VEANPDDPDYVFNLGYAYWIAHDTQAAIYWLRETVRRNPTDGDAHFVLGTALSAAGSAAEASREKELAHRLSSTYERWEKPTDTVPKGLERIKSDVELPHAHGIEARGSSLEQAGNPRPVREEQRDQRELAHFYLDHARRLYRQEHDREAASELQRALYLSPYEAEAHLLMGRIHLRNGRPRDAIDALKISLWSEETADAHLALGEAFAQVKDLQSARQEAERALQLDPGSSEARRLIARIDSR
jgi:tetratricopeptide (TPR) repeat protein